MANLAALMSVAAEGTTSTGGGEDATMLVAGATALEEGAGVDIVCRRKGNPSNQFYAETFTGVATVGAATTGVKRISF